MRYTNFSGSKKHASQGLTVSNFLDSSSSYYLLQNGPSWRPELSFLCAWFAFSVEALSIFDGKIFFSYQEKKIVWTYPELIKGFGMHARTPKEGGTCLTDAVGSYEYWTLLHARVLFTQLSKVHVF